MAQKRRTASPKQTKKAKTETPTAEQEKSAAASPPRWQKIVQAAGLFTLASSLPEVMLIASLAMARYLKNSDFSYPSEIVLDIVLLAMFITPVFYGLKFVLKSRLAAHIAGLLLAYTAYAFSYSFPRLQHIADWFIPNSATVFEKDVLTFIFLILVFGALGYGVHWLVQRNAKLKTLPILKFLIFVVCFIFVSQALKVGGRMWTIRQDLIYKQPAVSFSQPPTTKNVGNKPNIYYLVFDRYANDTTLKNAYGFDNQPLLSFLDEQGFVTRKDAYSNYPFTMMSISSTLAMGYHSEVGKQFRDDAKGFQTAFPYRTILDNPPVTQLLKKQGYKYNQLSSWWDFTRSIPAADSEPTRSFEVRLFGKSFWLTDLQRDIFGKSVLAPLTRKGITVGDTALIKLRNDRNPVQNFDSQFAALKTITANSKSQAAPQFTFAHIMSPHDPYIFDENGNDPTYNQDRTDIDLDETVKYTNQLTYLNTRIEAAIKDIRQNDPGAVVVIQADEGPYPKEFRGTLSKDHYYDPIDLKLPQMKQKYGILASYYLPGVDKQTALDQVTSSVNSFRFVLNQYLGYDLNMLPDCQFSAGDKFYLYNYQLVSGTLRGTQAPAACNQYK
jgi:hypothetical protein